jgi:hypothetical protein
MSGGGGGGLGNALRNLQGQLPENIGGTGAFPGMPQNQQPMAPQNYNYGQQGTYNTLAQDMQQGNTGAYNFGGNQFNYSPYGMSNQSPSSNYFQYSSDPNRNPNQYTNPNIQQPPGQDQNQQPYPWFPTQQPIMGGGGQFGQGFGGDGGRFGRGGGSFAGRGGGGMPGRFNNAGRGGGQGYGGAYGGGGFGNFGGFDNYSRMQQGGAMPYGGGGGFQSNYGSPFSGGGQQAMLMAENRYQQPGQAQTPNQIQPAQQVEQYRNYRSPFAGGGQSTQYGPQFGGYGGGGYGGGMQWR